MKKKDHVLKNIFFRIVPIQFKSTPLLDTVVALLGVVLGLLLTFNAVAMQFLFDSVSMVVASKGNAWECLLPLLTLAGTTIGVELIQGIFNFLADVIFKKSSGKIKMILFHKLQQVDPAQFENPAFLDDLNRAREGVAVMPYFCMSMCICVSFYLVYFISVGSYLYSLKPLLLVTLVLAFVPAMLGQIARLHVYWKLEQESAPVRRTYEYYQSTMCDREYYKETRTLGAFEYFYSAFENALRLFCRKQWKTEKKASLIQLSLDVIGFAGMGVSTVILFDATIANEISVGAFAAVFTALRAMFSMMHQIVCGHIANINQSFGKANNVIRLLDMPTVGGETKTPDMSEGIIMENVSFTYWGRENPAIKNVSLNIGPKETIAIVGENGAGKSTLVRLLTGIYRPTEGRVLIGGLDSDRTAPSSLYRGISGVFQKVQKYKMTLKENVILSVPQELTGSSDGTRIKRVLKEAGFNQDDIELETMLSPEYGGIDISGGQWQRLAIARGLYRDHEFIVLDEPTAAIDPVEETKIYLQFQEMAQDKCAIVVTHRLGSARLADRIIVMDKGKIIDMGTHEELLSRPGKYADMYAAQAKWYERNDENVTSYGVV